MNSEAHEKICGILKIPNFWPQQKNAILQIFHIKFQNKIVVSDSESKSVSKLKIKFGICRKK